MQAWYKILYHPPTKKCTTHMQKIVGQIQRFYYINFYINFYINLSNQITRQQVSGKGYRKFSKDGG